MVVRSAADTAEVADWYISVLVPAGAVVGALAAGALTHFRDRSARAHDDKNSETERLRAIAEEAILALHALQIAAHRVLASQLDVVGKRQLYATAASHDAERARRIKPLLDAAETERTQSEASAVPLRETARQIEERLRLHVHPKTPIFASYSNAVQCLCSILIAVERGSDETVDPAWPRQQIDYAISLRDGSNKRRETFAEALRTAAAVESPEDLERRKIRARVRLRRQEASFRFTLWRARRRARRLPPKAPTNEEWLRDIDSAPPSS